MKSMFKHLSLLLAAGLLPIVSFSTDTLTTQTINSMLQEKNIEKYFRLITSTYPSESTFILRRNTEYEFRVDESTGNIKCQQEESYEYMGLRSDLLIKYAYMDDNSGDNKVQVYEGNNSRKPDLNFRSMEVGSVFYDDIKQALYTVSLSDGRNNHIDFEGIGAKVVTSKTYYDARFFTRHIFVEDYPVFYQEVKFKIPNNINLELTPYNLPKDAVKNVEKTEDGKVITFQLYNTREVENRNNNPGGTFVYPHLVLSPLSFTVNGAKKVVFETTKDQYQWYSSLVKTMKQDPKQLEGLVAKVTKEKTTDREKIKALFYWVQDNIRYVAYEDGLAGFVPASCNNVYENRYGDCKGMANLLKQMLIIAGFDARLTWLGTSIIPYDYSVHSLAVDNHMICTLIHDGKKYFLDPTEKFVALGQYADRISGRQVLIEDGDNYILETIPNNNEQSNIVEKDYNLYITPELKLAGDVKIFYKGESGRSFLNVFHNLTSQHKDYALNYFINEGERSVKVHNINAENIEDRNKDISIKADIEIGNNVMSIEDKLFILPGILNFDYESKLDTNRRFGFQHDLQSVKKTTINIRLPENTSVIRGLESFKVSNENFDYQFDFKVTGDMMSITKTLNLKHRIIEVKYIPDWNEAMDKMDEQLSRVIVLK